jgi:phosphoribosylaminoimidazole-succinocarboxamide synthase
VGSNPTPSATFAVGQHAAAIDRRTHAGPSPIVTGAIGGATAPVEFDRSPDGADRIMEPADLRAHAHQILRDATIPELPNHYRGKVRDNYDLPDGRRVLIATDRLSAFDRILCAVPFKGQVLTQTARFWFEATRDICPNHVLDYPDPNVVIGRRLDILPVEIVVRDYLAGTTVTSVLTLYKSGQREMYGIRLPDGLRDNQRLPHPILTPTSKAFDGGHDAPLTPADIISGGLTTAAQWAQLSAYARALFARGQAMAAQRGLILVDTKYEFGTDADGHIVLADEIHTPDSSRYWRADSYEARFAAGERPESFDKDFVRNWVAARCDPYRDEIPPIPDDLLLATAAVYIQAFETITGQTFHITDHTGPVLDRIRTNLAFLLRT